MDAPLSQNVHFGPRGEGRFKGFHVVDVAATYNVPAFRVARPYVTLSVYNVLNEQRLIRWDVAVDQDVTAEPDDNGLAATHTGSVTFGLANDNNQFPVPSIGGTGGRTWRLAVGFRF